MDAELFKCISLPRVSFKCISLPRVSYSSVGHYGGRVIQVYATMDAEPVKRRPLWMVSYSSVGHYSG